MSCWESCRHIRTLAISTMGSAIVFCVATLLVAVPSVEAQPPSVELDLLSEMLDAGEYAPAVRFALDQPDPELRHRDLWRIAEAQAARGQRRAMWHTLAQVGDETTEQLFARRMLQDRRSGPAAAGAGGGSLADFDSLIELITSTIEPNTWEELGGPGTIDGFAGGVFVDAKGLLRRVPELHPGLRDQADEILRATASGNLRGISLRRLESTLIRDWMLEPMADLGAAGLGLTRITHVIADPEHADVILFGLEASDPDASLDMRVGDLMVLWYGMREGRGPLGCSIDPRPENLARAQQFLAASAQTPLRPGQRNAWLRGIRDAVGRQDVRVFGLEADCTTARILVEADVQLKLIGLGLQPTPRGMRSYLHLVRSATPAGDVPMEVMRWWFTLTDAPLLMSEDQLALELPKSSVQVLTENEFLDQQGNRQPIGASTEPNMQFAASFNEHFDSLAEQYPVLARLQGLFDLALAIAMIESRDLLGKVGWQPMLLTSGHPEFRGACPPIRETESVINHTVLGNRQIIASVSGGVVIEPKIATLRRPTVEKQRQLRRLQAEVNQKLSDAMAVLPTNRRTEPVNWHWTIANTLTSENGSDD